jgi:1,4-alpha-glucan branching enzyme
VDLVAGWEAVQLAKQVREWRARKGLSKPYVARTIVPEPVRARATSDTIIVMINACDTIDALEGVYELHIGEWKNEHTAAAAERKAQLVS